MASSETDLYGFPLNTTPLQHAERTACDGSALAQQPLWMEYISKDRLPNSEAKIKEMIRKGVPPPCRTWVWYNVSGAAKRQSSLASNYFGIMVSAGATSPCLPDIEQDITHTFSSHPWIHSPDGQAALKRVLSAYSVHNDKVGYCRAMNNIVGLLLVAMNRNEEKAFWLLAALVEDILYPGTYSRNLEGCQVEMKALEELMSGKLPKLHAHLQAMDCELSLIATDWYLCLFSTSLPAETACRVWDALFNEGPKVLFRVALALFKLNEEYLLNCNNAGDIVMAMRAAASSMHHHDKLMAMAFEGVGSLPMATIEKFRDLKAKEVEGAVTRREGGSGGGGGAPISPHQDHHGTQKGEKLAAATGKAKEGFGKFMTGFNKWADKTADKLAKAAEKMGIADDEPHTGIPHNRGQVVMPGTAHRSEMNSGSSGGGALNTPCPSGVLNNGAVVQRTALDMEEMGAKGMGLSGSDEKLGQPGPAPSGALHGPFNTPMPSGVLHVEGTDRL